MTSSTVSEIGVVKSALANYTLPTTSLSLVTAPNVMTVLADTQCGLAKIHIHYSLTLKEGN